MIKRPEIKVTQEMKDAGIGVLLAWDQNVTSSAEIVREIFLAMLDAAPCTVSKN